MFLTWGQKHVRKERNHCLKALFFFLFLIMFLSMLGNTLQWIEDQLVLGALPVSSVIYVLYYVHYFTLGLGFHLSKTSWEYSRTAASNSGIWTTTISTLKLLRLKACNFLPPGFMTHKKKDTALHIYPHLNH